MRPTIPYLQQKFEEFNKLCFEGKLAPIPIVLTKARTYLGTCAYKTHYDIFGGKWHTDFRLRISTLFDLPEAEIEDTIIHEMIHYYILGHQMEDTSPHGKLFRQMMNDINSRFGRHISVRHQLTAEQRAQTATERRKTHVVAVVRFKDGRTGFKCLPRNQASITKYYARIAQVSDAISADVYVTNNAYFNKFPASSALHVYFPTEVNIVSNLAGATLLKFNGSEWIPDSPQE